MCVCRSRRRRLHRHTTAIVAFLGAVSHNTHAQSEREPRAKEGAFLFTFSSYLYVYTTSFVGSRGVYLLCKGSLHSLSYARTHTRTRAQSLSARFRSFLFMRYSLSLSLFHKTPASCWPRARNKRRGRRRRERKNTRFRGRKSKERMRPLHTTEREREREKGGFVLALLEKLACWVPRSFARLYWLLNQYVCAARPCTRTQ